MMPKIVSGVSGEYSGKYPNRIKSVGSAGEHYGRGTVSVRVNDGRVFIVTARETGGVMPRVGDEFDYAARRNNPAKKPSPAQLAARKAFADAARAGTLTKGSTTKRAKNPAAKKPRVKYKDTAKNLRSDMRVGYSVHNPDMPGHLAIAWYSKKADAMEVAQEVANRTGKTLAVSRVQIYFGPID